MVDLKELGDGVSLSGEYTLERWMGNDGGGSLFAARTEAGATALVKLAPMKVAESAQLFDTWQRARHLRHENLLYLRDCGRVPVGADEYYFAVFERPDDNLAAALEHGPLSEEDTYTVLDALLNALRYLHGQGLIHGSIDAAHVVAIGETVKLSTASLREPEGLDGYPEDVRQLGELVKVLRAPEALGEPMATAVRHATDPDARMRWTLSEVAKAVERPPVAPVVEEAAPVPVAPPPVVVETPTAEPIPTVREEPVTVGAPPFGFPKWIFVGVAIVLFLILGLNLRRNSGAAAQAQPAVARPGAQAEAAAPLPPPPPDPKPSPLETLPKPAAGHTLWRVIAFTYATHDQAAAKAKTINQRWPKLQAAVYRPGERPNYFLVSLGGLMTRENAVRLQRRARAAGLPRDTYVQNYER